MKKSARLISILLAFVMAISTMPFTALADNVLDLSTLQVGDIIQGDYDLISVSPFEYLVMLNVTYTYDGENWDTEVIAPFPTEQIEYVIQSGGYFGVEDGALCFNFTEDEGTYVGAFAPLDYGTKTNKWVVTCVGEFTYDNDTINNALVIEPYHVHNLDHHNAVEATAQSDGNIEYWECSVCGKYFSDENAENEISADDITVAYVAPDPDPNDDPDPQPSGNTLNLAELQVGDTIVGDYDTIDFSTVTKLTFVNSFYSYGGASQIVPTLEITLADIEDLVNDGLTVAFVDGVFSVLYGEEAAITLAPTVDGEIVSSWQVTSVGTTVTIEGLADPNAHVHTYGEPVWSWTGYESAQATFTCTSDECNHSSTTVNAAITNEVTTAPTPSANGERTYTATVNFRGNEYTDTKTEEVEYVAETATVSYYDSSDTYHYKDKTATVLTGYETVLESGWYYVRSNLSYSNDLKINGNVNIIIGNNVTLEMGTNSILPNNAENSEDVLNIFREGYGALLRAASIECYEINIYGVSITATDVIASNNILFSNFSTTVRATNITSNGNITVSGANIYNNNPTVISASDKIFVTDGYVSVPTVSADTVNISGGMFYAGTSVEGNIILDFSGTSGNFYAKAITGNLTVANGKFVKDANNSVFSGTYTSSDISSVSNKYLYPATAYSVTFITNGNTVSMVTYCLENTVPNPPSSNSLSYEDENYNYVFTGWTDGTNNYNSGSALPAVTEDVVYTAIYTQTAKVPCYTVTWKSSDGSTIKTDEVPEGTSPVFTGTTPATYTDENCNSFVFSGWTNGTNTYATNELPVATEDVTYTTVFIQGDKLHTLTYHAAVTPASSKNGTAEYWSCDVCEKMFSDENGTNEIAADSLVIPYLEYRLYNDGTEACVVGYNGRSSYLSIPGTVPDYYPEENLRGKSVRAIYYEAFAGNTEITNVSMVFIKDIQSDAFRGCSNLTTVLIGTSLREIESYAFANCSNLESFSSTSRTLSVNAENAFSGCSKVVFNGKHDSDLKQTAHNAERPFIGTDDHTMVTVFEWNGYESAVATRKCENCDYNEGSADAVITSEVTKEATSSEDGVRTYTAKATIGDVEYTDTKTETIPAFGEPVNYNLTVTDEINVNFYVDMNQLEAEGGYIEYSYIKSTDDKSAERQNFRVDAEDMATASGGILEGDKKLTLAAAPAQFAEKYTIRIYDKDGNLKTDEPIETSISDYLFEIYNNDKFSSKQRALAKSMLDYGQCASNYFGYADIHNALNEGDNYTITSSFLNNDVNNPSVNGDIIQRKKATIKHQGSVNLTGVSYVALLEPEFRFYIDETNEVYAAMTNVEIESEADLTAQMVKTSKGFCVSVKGLKSSEFETPFTLTIGDTVLEYNGYAYLYSVLYVNSNAPELKQLAYSVYKFALASEEAFNS